MGRPRKIANPTEQVIEDAAQVTAQVIVNETAQTQQEPSIVATNDVSGHGDNKGETAYQLPPNTSYASYPPEEWGNAETKPSAPTDTISLDATDKSSESSSLPHVVQSGVDQSIPSFFIVTKNNGEERVYHLFGQKDGPAQKYNLDPDGRMNGVVNEVLKEAAVKMEKDNPTPPSNFKRNAFGLIPGIQYKFDELGLINWKAMIPTKYLMVKKDKEEQVKRKYKVDDLSTLDLSTVEDYFLFVKLGGMNYLATLRGYKSLRHHVDYVSDNKAVVTCTMEFTPNFENPDGFTCSGVANASIFNTSGGFESYIETFAENRSFTRCVRRALRINMVTEEELGGDDKKQLREDVVKAAVARAKSSGLTHEDVPAAATEITGFKPSDRLAQMCQTNNPPISFEAVKRGAMKFKSELTTDPETWTEFKSIGNTDAFILIGKFKK